MRIKHWRRIAIVIIWSLNIFLLLFEHYQIKKLKEMEFELNNIMETKVFVTRNRQLGEDVLNVSSSLYAASEEPMLGWLGIENNLIKTARKCGLKNVMINAPSEFTGDGNVLILEPVNLSFSGKYNDALRWIKIVENRFLPLDILRVTVSGNSSGENNFSETYTIVLRVRLKKLTIVKNGESIEGGV